jgi:hypothetical protein
MAQVAGTVGPVNPPGSCAADRLGHPPFEPEDIFPPGSVPLTQSFFVDVGLACSENNRIAGSHPAYFESTVFVIRTVRFL